jgi:hippurate hydrolase
MFVSQTPVVQLDKVCDPLLYSWKDEFKAIRQDFHRNPEIGLETPETSRKIVELLKSYGVDSVDYGLGGHGVVAVIKGRTDNGHAVGLRADIDALPMKEEGVSDHVSSICGRMHGCGHDGHAAMLLAVAKYLAATRNFDGHAVLIFQPGEEGWSGARHMIEDGLFDEFPVEEVYALHNSPLQEPGKFVLNYGAMQAAADALTITVDGVGGHGSRPHMNADPIVAASHIICALQTIVSRNVDPLDSAVVSLCSIHAGDPLAQSVTPASCEIVGTARTFKPETRDLVERRITEIAENTAKAFGCTAKVDYDRRYPPCVNTPEEAKAIADIAAEIVGEENVDRSYPRMMGGEDFSFMLERVPGAYVRIGQGGNPVHNPLFDFNDDVIPLGATVLVRTVERRLAHLASK